MKELIKEAKDILSEKYRVITTQQSDEPPINEFEQERIMRERKENPTVKEKFQEMTFKATKNMRPPPIPPELKPDTMSRAEELKNIRQRKDVKKNVPAKESSHKHDNGKEVEAILGNVNDEIIGVVHTVHDFVGGESRSEQLSHIRGRKNISRGIER